MKNNKFFNAINIFLFLFVSTTLFTIVSCNEVSIDLPEQYGKTVLSIMVQNDDRTICPELSPDQLTNFKLTGYKDGDVDENDQPVIYTLGSSTGYADIQALTAAEISLPEDAVGNYWYFTLTAECNAEGVKRTYTSTVTKTIRAGANAVKFTYSFESDYDTGTGDFAVTLDWSKLEGTEGKVNRAFAVLEDVNEIVSNKNYKNLSISNKKVTVADTNIPAGTYRLKISLNKGDAQVAYWQDFVKIAGNFSSNATFTIEGFLDAYSITYNLNDNGEGVINPCPTTVSAVTDVFENGTPQREGYTFINWYTDSAFKIPFNVRKCTGNTTLYARWLSNTDPHIATKNTIVDRVASASSSDISNPFLIKIYGEFKNDDFDGLINALQARDLEKDEDYNPIPVYIALDFSEAETEEITEFTYFYYSGGCNCLAGLTIPNTVLFESRESYWGAPLKYGFTGEFLSSLPNLCYINVSEDNQYYSSIDGVLYSKDGTKLVAFPRGKTCQNDMFVIPAGVTHVLKYAFYNDLKIQQIYVKKDVEVFYANAFYNCRGINSFHFEDNDHAWNGYYGEIFNIEAYFNKELESNSTFMTWGYLSKDSVTFEERLAESEVIQFTVTEGAGTYQENHDILEDGFNTITVPIYSNNLWYSFATTPGHTYYIYYCKNGNADDFENVPDPDNLSSDPKINIYSADGLFYVEGLGWNGAALPYFTATEKQGVENIAYLCLIPQSTYLEKKLYMLIRDVPPSNSGEGD